jgi:hypothetical protein
VQFSLFIAPAAYVKSMGCQSWCYGLNEAAVRKA